ncbi:MAG: TetR/AcrR family transcriptional regulator [Ruminococcus sp.]|nr:TetR/AcrR family transcriptional regulator [Ruminococcus sp.]
MNKKGNQRYRETCQRIEGAMLGLLEKKEPEQISVSEICRSAQVHRTTFYRHYKDIPDLMNHVAGQMFRHVMEGFELSDDATSGEGFVKLFYYIRENRQMFKSLMNYYSSRRYEFADFPTNILPVKMERHIKEIMEEHGYDDKESVLYTYVFFTEGLKAVIYRWLERECAESPEKMWEIVSREYIPAPTRKRRSGRKAT